MSRRTLYTGIRELQAMDTGDSGPPARPSGDPQRVRRRGGGRPKASERQPGLRSACERILEANSAGSPTDPGVVWTHLKPMQRKRPANYRIAAFGLMSSNVNL